MKRKLSKILAALAALFLIIIVILFANSVIGNPISKSLAKKDIKKYLAATYANTDYKLQRVSFNFKFHEYNGYIISPSSEDSNFSITWRDGKILYDSFDFNVTERQNTLHRYETEAREQIDTLLSSIPEANISDVHVIFCKDYYESDLSSSLVLDSPYDKSLELPLDLTISCDSSNPALEEYASILSQAHAILTEQGYHIDYYSIDNYSNETAPITLNAYDISPEEIEGGNLLSLLKEAYNRSEDDNATDDKYEKDLMDKESDHPSYERELHVLFFERN